MASLIRLEYRLFPVVWNSRAIVDHRDRYDICVSLDVYLDVVATVSSGVRDEVSHDLLESNAPAADRLNQLLKKWEQDVKPVR